MVLMQLFCITVGAFKVLAADKVKAQQRLADIRKTLL